MATGIRANGTDLDTLLEPRGTSSKRSDVNIDSNGGVDISNRFYSLTEGGTAPSATGIRSGNADLNTLFAGIGTTGGSVLLDTAWTISNHLAGQLSTCSVTFNTNGSISVVRNGGGDTLPASDNWWTDNPETGIGSSYQVAFTAWDGGSAWSTGPAINVYTTMSSAVTWTCRVIAKASPATQAANGVTFSIRRLSDSLVQDTITNCNHSASN